MVKPGAVVIDVGMNRTPEGLVGDVDFATVKEVAGQITPVPGGVGLLTVTMLLHNTLVAAAPAVTVVLVRTLCVGTNVLLTLRVRSVRLPIPLAEREEYIYPTTLRLCALMRQVTFTPGCKSSSLTASAVASAQTIWPISTATKRAWRQKQPRLAEVGDQVRALHSDCARLRPQQSGDHAENRRFAASRRTK